MARAQEPPAEGVKRPAPSRRARKAAEVATAVAEAAPPKPDDKVTFGMKVAAAWSWRILVVLTVIAVVGFLIVQLRYVAVPFFSVALAPSTTTVSPTKPSAEVACAVFCSDTRVASWSFCLSCCSTCANCTSCWVN